MDEHEAASMFEDSRHSTARGSRRPSLEEAPLLWESIPERLRTLGPEEVANRFEAFDWSHIRHYSQGGGHEASSPVALLPTPEGRDCNAIVL